jgi:DNA-binding transcriptional ArsR family regulator
LAAVRPRSEDVRRHILENVREHPTDVAAITARRFGISRQAVSQHLQRLVGEGALTPRGNTRGRTYELAAIEEWTKSYDLSTDLAEDRVWRDDIAPSLSQLPGNVFGIWQYGFTEMFNNAIDHSSGHRVLVDLERTAADVRLAVFDDGVGIFRKIQTALGLLDERHAVLEIAKGKLTTDPAHHTGEGIFFTSRMFDDFEILSGGVFLLHRRQEVEDWILEQDVFSSGTAVFMELGNYSKRTTKRVFDRFTSGDDYGFTKTVVPVQLARYGDENLISRSQAKRLLARVDRFKTVVLDFRDVTSLGQAFADEIFRVFPSEHPEVDLREINVSSGVKRMIARARSAREG